MQQPESLRSLWRLYRGFARFARDNRRYMLVNFVCVFVIAITNTLIIWKMTEPLTLLQAQDFGAIPRTLLTLAIIIVVNQIGHFGALALTAQIELRFAGRLRGSMMRNCLAASFPIMDRYPRGDVLSRLSGEVDGVANFVIFSLFSLVSHVFIFVFYAGMLFWIDPWLATISMLGAPLFVLHQRFFGHRKQVIAEAALQSSAALLSLQSEALTQLKGISSLRTETIIAQRHDDAFARLKRYALRGKILDAWINGSVTALIYLGAVIIVFFGVMHVKAGDLAVGALVSFLFYLGYLSVPVRGTAQLALQSREVAAAARRIQEILKLNSAVTESPTARPLTDVRGRIQLDHVTFSYDTGKPVFDNISLDIHPNETVALVGPSGAGKSTLAKLLMRFHDPQQGRILVDGVDIRNVTLDSLRHEVGVVWQEPFLLSDTIRNNMLLAQPYATDEEIEAACRTARAWEFIQALPSRLATHIGAGGVELSTGQKQRLSLAQAFLHNSHILILDEASSALDSQTERYIAEAMDELRKDRTTLIIAHRFSAIRSADRVVFFNGDGSITVGTHETLWASHPTYRAAVEWQTAALPNNAANDTRRP